MEKTVKARFPAKLILPRIIVAFSLSNGALFGCATSGMNDPVSSNAVEWEISKHAEAFTQCYRITADSGGHTRGGEAKVAFTVNPDGKVSGVEMIESNLKSREADQCMVDTIRKIQFPPPTTGKPFRSGYALQFGAG